MDGRFAPALQDVSLQLIIQQFTLLSSYSFSPLPISLPLSTRLLSICSFHLSLYLLFHPPFFSHRVFPRWDSNWQLSDQRRALSVIIYFRFSPSPSPSPFFSHSFCYISLFISISCLLILHVCRKLNLVYFGLSCLHSFLSSSFALSRSFSCSLFL